VACSQQMARGQLLGLMRKYGIGNFWAQAANKKKL
jgi:hypothetical protein